MSEGRSFQQFLPYRVIGMKGNGGTGHECERVSTKSVSPTAGTAAGVSFKEDIIRGGVQ